MKMISALFLFVMAFSAFAQNANNTADAPKVAYMTVLNGTSATTLTKGMVVCFNNTVANAISVDLCYAEGAKPAGIVASTSCAVGVRCKLQTKGFINFGKFDYLATATVAGGMIYADVDGDLTRPASVTTAMFPVGVTFAAVAADTSALKVYIDL